MGRRGQMADDEWEQMNVNERLQVAAQRLAERLKGFKPEIVPPDEREQEAERFRRLEERIAAHDRHHREQEGGAPTTE